MARSKQSKDAEPTGEAIDTVIDDHGDGVEKTAAEMTVDPDGVARGALVSKDAEPTGRRANPRALVAALIALRDMVADLHQQIRDYTGAEADVDATAPAGELAEALIDVGGRLADETNPWPLKWLLEPTSTATDPHMTDATRRFVTEVLDMVALGERASKLGLPTQVGLERFAKIARSAKNRRDVVLALEESKAADNRDRDARHARAHEARTEIADSLGKPKAAPSVDDDLPPNPLIAGTDEAKV